MKTAMHYYVFTLDIWKTDNAVLSTHPPQIEEHGYRFRDGVPLADWFPRDAEYAMSADFPNARNLYDLQQNTLELLVASKSLRSVMEELGCTNIEFLPITIRNHRNKIASHEHAIVNILGLTECVDRDRSIFESDALMPTRFLRIKKLMLVEEAIPKDLQIFRLKEQPWTHLVTETFKNAVENRGLRGMIFTPPEEFDSAFHL